MWGMSNGFFDFLGELGSDMWELRQRREIRDLQERVSRGERMRASDGDTERLEQRVAFLSRELATVKIAFDVLSHAIVETGALDAATLDRRLKEAVERVSAAQPQPPVVCGNCGLSYAPAQVTQTDAGPRCKRCREL